jgi:hypothetical protein
MVVW